MDISELDVNELALGIQEEAEHTGDMATRIKIALDHLKEKPNYYSLLGTVMDGLTEITAEQASGTRPEMGVVKSAR